jgi:HPt (histidine-containing phosphotransfer) domain-containing protein
MHARPAVDTHVLRTRFVGSEELLRRIAEMFLAEVPVQVETLRTAVAAGDVETIAAVNHSLVNTAGTIEATTLTQHARAMEVQARKGELLRPADQLAAIEHELVRIETSLRELLRRLASA